MDRIDAINGREQKTLADTRCNPETVPNDEDVQLLMYIVYLSLMVHYWNTIDGKLNKFIPRMNGSKIKVRMAIIEPHA